MEHNDWTKQPTAQPTARPNIVMFIVMSYYFVIGRHFVQPLLLDPFYEIIGIYPLSSWQRILNIFFRDFGILIIVYLIYLLIKKKSIRSAFSITKMTWQNVAYITVMTLTIRVFFNLIESGVPFLWGSRQVPMQNFYFMDIGSSLIHNAILATLFEELVFRGFLWHEYRKQGVSYWKMALAIGLFFGIIHGGTFNIIHTTIAGIFFYAPLIYFTRSIWSVIIHHAIINAGYTLISPTFYISNQADFDAFMPTYLIILVIATIILLPFAIICAKKFYHENKHHLQVKENLPAETKSFKISYWILIAIMVATFLRA